jgi:hypothetical protein
MADIFRLFKDASLIRKAFEAQVRVIRNLDPNSAVIGVCGIPNIVQADPWEDGWFFSEFFAVRHLLKGIKKQQWFLAITPESLVENHGEYLHHGSDRGENKIVLDKKILENNEHVPETLQVTGCDELLDKFLGAVRDEIADENRQGRGLVLYVFWTRGPGNPRSSTSVANC